MANNSSNKVMVPEAKAALEQFKMESASEVGVTLNKGYNGDLTSRQAGSIGGQMVKKMSPVRPSQLVLFLSLEKNISVLFPVNILIDSFIIPSLSGVT